MFNCRVGCSACDHVLSMRQVKEDSYNAFEEVWRTRESHLKEMPGFIRFAMLKCKSGNHISTASYARLPIEDLIIT